MKNLFKNNIKTIAATALAAVVTVSMSFTAPQTIDMKANEVASVEATKTDISKDPVNRITKVAKVTKVIILTTTATDLVTTIIDGKTSGQNNSSLNEMVQLKLSQLDQQ